MPTYEYACEGCGHAFEVFQQMSDAVKRKCPECGRLKLQRLIGTGAGVIFKGGGFYETDYRSDSYKKAAEADKKAAEPASASGSNGGCACGADAKTQAKNGCGSGSSEMSKKSKKSATKRNSAASN